MVSSAPAFTVGVGLTIISTLSETEAHGAIPVVVSMRVAVPLKPAGGVHVAFNVFALGVKVPPAGVLHVPPVAAPPILPDNALVVPP